MTIKIKINITIKKKMINNNLKIILNKNKIFNKIKGKKTITIKKGLKNNFKIKIKNFLVCIKIMTINFKCTKISITIMIHINIKIFKQRIILL